MSLFAELVLQCFAAGDVNEDIGPCDQPSLDAESESTALIAMMEYALTLCDIPDVHLFCHFDAMAGGFAAMGANHRQRDARILMILERKIERCGGTSYWNPCLCTPRESME